MSIYIEKSKENSDLKLTGTNGPCVGKWLFTLQL